MPDTLSDIALAVAAGRLTAVESSAAALARIAEKRGLNAIVSIDAERTLEEAALIDRRIARDEHLPLAGVPIAVKDLIWVEGRRITQGSRLFADFIAPADAEAIARLKAAGAVVVGIANTSEFGCKGVTTNPLFGPTLHPEDARLTPGGSSGGCASAVAGGLVPAAIGTDAGGSSRRPAAHVGCVGFKPTTGVVPDEPGFPTLGGPIGALCPMTLSVADARLLFEIMAGRAAVDAPKRPALGRIAYSPAFGMDYPINPEIADMMDDAVAALRTEGFAIDLQGPRWPEGADPAALMPLQYAGLADLYGDAFRRDPDVFDPDIAVQIEAGLRIDAAALARARELSAAIAATLDRFMRAFDAIVSPTVPCFPWPHAVLGPARIAGQEVGPRAHAALTPYANHGGIPAISIPLGRGAAGLPAGLHICAARGSDSALLGLAARMETVLTARNQQRRHAPQS
ncbi:amidase [Aureimonas altamirensis]|uniref:amidase n=1 Tax=Aureimonas altamirensis TaxID=370622 RepID=UPI001E5B43A8|nr:amidase [Aureimonas altamirensis]UHD43791.1 amidase [Aureimonas altamirensis]